MPTLRDSGVRLGTKKPSGRSFKKGHKKMGGRKKGTPNRATQEIRAFFTELMHSPEYQASLKARILAGKAVPIEQLGFYYVAGKPTDNLKVESPSLAKILEIGVKKGMEKRRAESESDKREPADDHPFPRPVRAQR